MVSSTLAQAEGACAPAPRAGDPVELYPADQIRSIKPGMIAHAYTVFQGMKAECFDLRIEGVEPNGIGPGHDLVYFTPLPGHAAQTNIVHGMSGSPVYLDGKLLGALAFDISQDFTVAPTGGITPAVYMKEILEDHAASTPGSSFLAAQFGGYDPKKAPPETRLAGGIPKSGRVMTTLRTTGISREMQVAFQDNFRQNGFEFADGGASVPDAQPEVDNDPEALAPGEMMVIPLVSGDTSMGVAGTVTYNDGKQVLAFGHPFNQSGPVRLPMLTGEVIKIVDSSNHSFKIAKGMKNVGALVEDRATGVMGVLGEEAPTIPMVMHVTAGARSHDFHFAISHVPNMVPLLTAMTVASVLDGSNQVGDGNTMRLSATVKIAGHADLTFSVMHMDESGAHAKTAEAIARWMMAHVDIIVNHPSEPGEIQSVEVNAEIIAESRLMSLESIKTAATTAKAGDTVPVEATFRMSGYPNPLTHTFNVKLPSDLHPGSLTLNLITSGDFNEKMRSALAGEKDEDSLDDTLKILHTEHANGALYVHFDQPDPPTKEEKKKKKKKHDEDEGIVTSESTAAAAAATEAKAKAEAKAAASEVTLPLDAVFVGKAQKVTLTIQ